MRSDLLLIFLGAGLIGGCSNKEESKSINVTTQLRSTGTTTTLSLHNGMGQSLANLETFLANSTVTVEAFEIPIGRINLTAGDTGSGYTEASPNFHTCPGTTNEECMVDVVKTGIDDLLASSDEVKSIEFGDEKTYTGISVEVCAEGQGGEGKTFKAKITASAILGNTTYYTNATTGVSTTGPAEATEIEMPCQGSNSDLLKPITVTPESNVDLVFWAEPAGAVLIANNGDLINSNCTSGDPGAVVFCANMPSFFGTTVAGEASVERYALNVKTAPTINPNGVYADMLFTVVYDSEGAAFGSSLKQVYTNTDGEEKLMHGPLFDFSSVSETDGLLTLKYGYADSEREVISGLPRVGTGSDLTISELVNETVTFDSSRL